MFDQVRRGGSVVQGPATSRISMLDPGIMIPISLATSTARS
jgi:hypothetical protein